MVRLRASAVSFALGVGQVEAGDPLGLLDHLDGDRSRPGRLRRQGPAERRRPDPQARQARQDRPPPDTGRSSSRGPHRPTLAINLEIQHESPRPVALRAENVPV